MKYFKINQRLDDTIKKDLILFAKSNQKEYYSHNSTVSGDYTNLNFLFTKHEIYDKIIELFPVRGNNIAILNIKPGKKVLPHTDGVNLKRDSVVIFPLWPGPYEYTPCYVEEEAIPYMDCYAFSTQKTHWINNNTYERFSLQIFYDLPLEELYEKFSKVDGLV